MSALGMSFYLFDVCIYVYIYHVFYGGPHGRIADRLMCFASENIVNNNNNNNNNNK